MAHPDVETAVEARLRTFWADQTLIYTANDGNQEQPSDGETPFLTLQFPVADVQRWALGDRYYREEGGIRIVLSVPQGTGKGWLGTKGEEIASLFRDRKFDGVETQAPSSAQIDDREDAGGYFVAYVVAPYTFNYRD